MINNHPKKEWSSYLHTITQLSNVGIWEYNLDTGSLIWDETMWKLHGTAPQSSPEIFHASHLPELLEAMEQSETYEREYSMTSPDGKLLHLRKRGTLHINDDQQRLIVGVCWDITAEKERQKTLERSLQQDRLFVNQSPSAIAMFDREVKYLAASDKWREDYGLINQDIIGKSHYDIFPEIGDNWKEIHQNSLKGRVNKSEDERFLRADGTVQWISWDVRPWYDIDGQVGGIMMITQDVTLRHNAMEYLRISEEKFRKAFSSSAVGMAIVDMRGKWLEVNNQLCEMMEYSVDELLKTNFQELTHPDDLKVGLDTLRKIKSGEIESCELHKRYISKTGKTIWAITSIAIIKDDQHKPLYNVAQITNISNLKAAEQKLTKANEKLEEKNKELMQFSYIASHDLREPLNTVQSFVRLLEMDYLDKRDQRFDDYIQFIKESTDRMDHMVSLLLDYSRLTKDVVFGPVDLNNVVKDVLNDLHDLIQTKEAKITVDKNLESIIGSEVQLRILFQNLISNALKFCPKNIAPEIIIGQDRTDRTIYVKDNGLGIDPLYHQRIFEIFQRLNHREEYPGSGIGLANCKKIVDKHGGKIWVESELGKGAKFCLQLN